jgi:hypothetical protein
MARPDSNPGEWRHLYRAAIFETNPAEKSNRIAEAEAAVVKRLREILCDTTLDAEAERDALDDALYALRAWRTALKNKTSAA